VCSPAFSKKIAQFNCGCELPSKIDNVRVRRAGVVHDSTSIAVPPTIVRAEMPDAYTHHFNGAGFGGLLSRCRHLRSKLGSLARALVSKRRARKCNRFTVASACRIIRFQTLDGEAATSLYAARGRRIPFNSNSPTGSTFMASSTFVSTRGLMRICPGLASSQSRDATLDTVPIAA
jgi:hypothetical protein